MHQIQQIYFLYENVYYFIFFLSLFFKKCGGGAEAPPAPPAHPPARALKSGTVETSPQRPSWGHKKVAVVERWPLWEGRGVIMTKFCQGSKTCLSCQIHAYCIKCGGGAVTPPAPPPARALKRGTVEPSPQRPSWGHKKVAVVGRQGYNNDKIFVREAKHVYHVKFMLTVPHNSNPIVNDIKR